MLLSLPLFLFQWAVGGLFFTWMTTRSRTVSLGYSWVNKVVYSFFLVLAIIFSNSVPFQVVAFLTVLFCVLSLFLSFKYRKSGVKNVREQKQAKKKRVSDMVGNKQENSESEIKEYDPIYDLISPLIGLLGMLFLTFGYGFLDQTRILLGALFLGAITDAMLLGHWYLNQPGLSRKPLIELVDVNIFLWFPVTILYLIQPGMIDFLSGKESDGYDGILGWFWIASVITTIIMLALTRLALKEKQYSAVMAATGLLYLAILTTFCMDLVARGLLNSIS